MLAYKNLIVYNKAFTLNQIIYKFVKSNTRIPNYITTQLGRANLSIMLNIAEGSAKIGERDRRNFFVIARGSAFECSSIIDLLYAEKEINENFKTELQIQYEEISKILFKMIQNLS